MALHLQIVCIFMLQVTIIASQSEAQCGPNLTEARRAFVDAEEYNTVRPNYTAESAKYLLQQAGVYTEDNDVIKDAETPVIVLELGCGTGLFTKTMMEVLRGNPHIRYIASDPTPSMAEVFQKYLPEVEFISCKAESIPLANGSVTAIFAAASFHWFSNEEAFKEMHRVLKPGGKLGYITNNINDESGPRWQKEARQLLNICYRKSGAPVMVDFSWRDALMASPYFKNHREDTSRCYFMQGSMEMCHRCLASYGGVTAAPEEDRKQFEESLWRVLHKHYTEKGVEFEGIDFVVYMYFCESTKTE